MKTDLKDLIEYVIEAPKFMNEGPQTFMEGCRM